MGFGIGSIGGFFKHVGTDVVHGGEHLWHDAVNGAKSGAHAVATVVRSNDAATAKAWSWIDSGEHYVESKTDQARAWLRQHGGIAGKAASDYLGFTEGADKAVFDTAKGLVQLGSNVQQLGNPLEWAANPGANIARVKAGFQAAVGLGKLVNLTQPASWAADPQGNAHMVSALWHSAVTNFEADPSKSAGYVAGTIATFFIPGGGEEAAAGDLTKVGELGADGSRITADGANAVKGAAGDNPTVWVQHGPDAGPIREYQPHEVSGTPDVGNNVSTPNGDGTVVSRGDPPNKPDVRINEPNGAGGTGGTGGTRGTTGDPGGAGDPAATPKVKTRGQSTEQLSPTGLSRPVPLTPAEKANVENWSKIYNTYIKTSRETDISSLPRDIQQLIGKADNSIAHNMTPDDLAAVIKEQRGVPIYKADGTLYRHALSEWPQARLSVLKAVKAIKEQLKVAQEGSQEYNLLQRKLGDLSKILDNYERLQKP